MEDGSSWLGGHDWTSVEKAQRVSHNMEKLLLPAEDINAEAHAVILVNLDAAGTLFITNFRLIFVLNDEIKELGTIPVATIERFSKQKPSSSTHRGLRLLQIVGKDMRTLVFAFRPHMKQRRNVYDALLRWTRPLRLWDLYAFSGAWAKSCGTPADPRSRLRSEYLRIIAGKDYWKLSNVNADYKLTPTYPSLLVMPAAMSDEEIQQAMSFRARCRLPALSWQHPVNGAVLARSSQPLIGLAMNTRNIFDEKLVGALCMMIRDPRRKLYIADARPRKNAFVNGAMGGGSESSAYYNNSEVVYLGIDNIHAMRDSQSRLRDVLDMYGNASSDGPVSPLLRSGAAIWVGGNFTTTAEAVSAFGGSNWLTHIFLILAGASWITARIALEGSSVLVHCSDGWDRTTQLVALAELMLDPYYRTIRGFQALIEKDWLAFGHPFADRHNLPTFVGIDPPFRNVTGTSSNVSPIFLQWIDCVAQLLRLYPRAFEFSSAFLVELLDSVLSCRFGNFLCNSEKERVNSGVNEASACIWSYFSRLHAREGRDHKHFNVFYEPFPKELVPPAPALVPTLWPQFYLRWAFAIDHCPPGDEIITDARSRVLAAEKNAQCAEERQRVAEGQMGSLQDKIRFLEESLKAEKAAHTSAKAAAQRARSETRNIKQAVEAMGCEVNFNTRGVSTGVSIMTLDAREGDEEEGSSSNRSSGSGASSSSANGNSKKNSPRGRTENPLMKNGSLDISRWGLLGSSSSKKSCAWPQTACPRRVSAMDGIAANFEDLQGVSITDDYFGSSLQPGVT